ncbi:MAG: hypothetical protein COA79_00435 [Planctomycetota bacterium]|nr:MAG: hypothetical protein COA79_00435 [Planctomycetota bacterium]
MNIKYLGKRIREQREKRNMKQVDIAHALQISSQAVSKWERGENAPDITILLDLAKLLGVTTDWLLGGASGELDTFEATVICTSMNNFAKKSEECTPKEMALWANSIFFNITEASLQNDGIPVKYVGDGYLCFFTGIDHTKRAIKTAITAKVNTLNADLKMSIHSGQIYLGSIGHPDYCSSDIIGETVNKAFIHLHWIAENCTSGIGISQKSFSEINSQFKTNEHYIKKMIGIENPVTIHELIYQE